MITYRVSDRHIDVLHTEDGDTILLDTVVLGLDDQADEVIAELRAEYDTQ